MRCRWFPQWEFDIVTDKETIAMSTESFNKVSLRVSWLVGLTSIRTWDFTVIIRQTCQEILQVCLEISYPNKECQSLNLSVSVSEMNLVVLTKDHPFRKWSVSIVIGLSGVLTRDRNHEKCFWMRKSKRSKLRKNTVIIFINCDEAAQYDQSVCKSANSQMTKWSVCIWPNYLTLNPSKSKNHTRLAIHQKP